MSVSADTTLVPTTTKRRPGRPRKSETSQVDTITQRVASEAEAPAKRRPGRPKGSKNKPKTVEDRAWEDAAPKVAARSTDEAPAKRRPGRPKGSTNKPRVIEENGQKIIRVEAFTATPEQVIGKVDFMNGLYRGYKIVGTFDMVRPYKDGGNGDGFITIREPNGKRTRVTVGRNSEGRDYRVHYNERGKALIEEMNRPKKPGRPRNPNTVRRVSMPSTLIPN